jgi:hypothetical protein
VWVHGSGASAMPNGCVRLCAVRQSGRGRGCCVVAWIVCDGFRCPIFLEYSHIRGCICILQNFNCFCVCLSTCRAGELCTQDQRLGVSFRKPHTDATSPALPKHAQTQTHTHTHTDTLGVLCPAAPAVTDSVREDGRVHHVTRCSRGCMEDPRLVCVCVCVRL